MPVFN
jgi:hypothetical protein